MAALVVGGGGVRWLQWGCFMVDCSGWLSALF